MKVTKKVALQIAVAALLPLGLIAPAGAADSVDVTLYAPADLKGVPTLPFTGETVKFTDPITGVGPLSVSNMQGPEGTDLAISASGLKANTEYTLTWSTAKGAWKAQLLPNSVNYTGYQWDKFNVILAKVTTDANGSLKFATKFPNDFGGPHDIYAILDGVAVAKGGVQMTPTISISPKSGPVGTPITVTYKHMGPNLYTGGISVLWDNEYAGEAQGVWTRGQSIFQVYAAGGTGKHLICGTAGIGVQYMNINQSPVPYAGGDCVTFTTTKDNGPKAATITYPQDVSPTVTQRTLMNEQIDPTSKASMVVSASSGKVGDTIKVSVTGLAPSTSYSITWATVVGNRVNCTTGTCWVYSGVPISTVTSDANGAVTTDVAIPDHLGGFHAIQIKKGDLAQAQQAIFVKQSIFAYKDSKGKTLSLGVAKAQESRLPEDRNGSGTPTLKFKAGEEITIAMKGVGWTQLDNTMAVTYDNNYIGYGCGFNSNGYMVIHLRATGAPGTHIIDLHPVYYSNQPSFANTQYSMLPILSYNSDNFGLALGYKQPAVHFEIQIVK
jgi:hypothetical protein